MTDREKAIVMAYTGYCMLAGDKLKVFYEYVGELLGRPVYTHEFVDPDIQEKASNDFYKLCRETTPDLQKEMEYWHKLSQSYEHTICTLAQAIAQNGEKQWIPCSERLPTNEEHSYWICTDGGYQCQCRWKKNKYGLGSSENYDWHIMDVPQYSRVVAWMPLPQPWKEEKEEGEPIPHWRGQMDGCLPFQKEERE